MNKQAMIGIGLVAVLIVVGAGALYASKPKSNSATSSMGTMDMSKSPSEATTPTKTEGKDGPGLGESDSSTTRAVAIKGFQFNEANITVKKGTTVTWSNADDAVHTVTKNGDQAGPDSGTLASGKSYSFTFNTVGTFNYHCKFHPDMTGSVTVTE